MMSVNLSCIFLNILYKISLMQFEQLEHQHGREQQQQFQQHKLGRNTM